MSDESAMQASLGVTSETSGLPRDEIEDRRKQNREFMRRWRTDPCHLEMERSQRRRRYYDVQKQRPNRGPGISPQTTDNEKKRCGFCWKRPAVGKIVRLQVSESAPDGYVKMHIPYCGVC